jgi:hypothetical protein
MIVFALQEVLCEIQHSALQNRTEGGLEVDTFSSINPVSISNSSVSPPQN